jgi:hypothetical protein
MEIARETPISLVYLIYERFGHAPFGALHRMGLWWDRSDFARCPIPSRSQPGTPAIVMSAVMSAVSRSLVAEGLHGIHARGAARRHIAGRERHQRQHRGRGGHDHRVRAAHLEQHGLRGRPQP